MIANSGMPVVECFLDTNILLYAISTEPAESTKARLAGELLKTTDWAWSAQVAAEFINVSTSSRRPAPLTLAQAEKWIHAWLPFPMAAIDAAIIQVAIHWCGRYQLSYYDAQIIAAAASLGCTTVYSEDFNHGPMYGPVRVINPFVVSVP